ERRDPEPARSSPRPPQRPRSGVARVFHHVFAPRRAHASRRGAEGPPRAAPARTSVASYRFEKLSNAHLGDHKFQLTPRLRGPCVLLRSVGRAHIAGPPPSASASSGESSAG